MIDLDRTLLARVAESNPHLASAVLRIVNELTDGEIPDPTLLRQFGQHLAALGRLVEARADHLERPEGPAVIIDTAP